MNRHVSVKTPEVTVYTAGTFDMFHIGHLNLLRMAKGLGHRLIVGVSTDSVVEEYKPNCLVMGYEDRHAIVSAIRYVDACIPQRNRDKFAAWKNIRFDVLAVGDDWRGKDSFEEYERKLLEVGVKVVYLPYTSSVSSSKLRARLSPSAIATAA